jgi:hypothetical protein
MRSILSVALLVIVVSAWICPFPAEGGETVFRGESVMMTKRIDGKSTERNLVVTVTVEYSDGRYTAKWDAVRISPVLLPNGVKRTSLRAQHYSTGEGTIKNLVVKKDAITFDIVRSFGDLNVVCARKGEFDFDIRATGTHYKAENKVTYTEDWVMTGNITLPSPSVFGYPDRKPKSHTHR